MLFPIEMDSKLPTSGASITTWMWKNCLGSTGVYFYVQPPEDGTNAEPGSLRWDAQLLVDCGMTAVGHPVALLDHVESWNGRNGQGNISSRLDFGLVKHHNSTGSVIWDSLDRSFPSREIWHWEVISRGRWYNWWFFQPGLTGPNFWTDLEGPWRPWYNPFLLSQDGQRLVLFTPGFLQSGSQSWDFTRLIVSSNKPPHFDVLNTKKLDTPHPNKYGCCAVSEWNTWNGCATCLYVYTFCGSFDEHILTSNSQLRWDRILALTVGIKYINHGLLIRVVLLQ